MYRGLRLPSPESRRPDLDTAIQLSGGHGEVTELAHTQRGLVRRLQVCDEGALVDFKAAGGRLAEIQVVAMNPYNMLISTCNQN